MRIVHTLLEIYPPQPHQQQSLSGEAHHSMELFSGFYALNTMLIEIARKQELSLLLRDKRNPADGTLTLYDEKDMASVTARTYNLIGKDLVMQDSRDPLGSTALKSAAEQRAMYEKYRVY